MERFEQYTLPLEEDTPKPTLPRAEEDLIQEALSVLERRHEYGEILSSPDITRNFLRLRLADYKHEVFGCIFLTQRHAVIAVEDIFTGSVAGAAIHPRVVAQKALAHNAAALVCYHNHPSGNTEPSEADRTITLRLKDALELVDVRVLDHLVVSAAGCVSLAERGIL